MSEKIKQIFNFIKKKFQKQEIFFIFILILTTIAAFTLGKISEQYKISINQKESIILEKSQNLENVKLVASKKGEKYHLPWCSGGLRIVEKNRIYFSNKKKAEKAGYTPAKNCEGL